MYNQEFCGPMQPDIIDLTNWLMSHDRTLFDILRYITIDAAYPMYLSIWGRAGFPELPTEE